MNIVIFVTAKDFKEAKRISQALVERKYIACANIVGGVRSFFWWEGKVDTAQEALLILKTKRSLFKKVEQLVKSLHSYSVPEIIAMPIVAGSKEYLKWVNDSVGAKKAG